MVLSLLLLCPLRILLLIPFSSEVGVCSLVPIRALLVGHCDRGVNVVADREEIGGG